MGTLGDLPWPWDMGMRGLGYPIAHSLLLTCVCSPPAGSRAPLEGRPSGNAALLLSPRLWRGPPHGSPGCRDGGEQPFSSVASSASEPWPRGGCSTRFVSPTLCPPLCPPPPVPFFEIKLFMRPVCQPVCAIPGGTLGSASATPAGETRRDEPRRSRVCSGNWQSGLCLAAGLGGLSPGGGFCARRLLGCSGWTWH